MLWTGTFICQLGWDEAAPTDVGLMWEKPVFTCEEAGLREERGQ